MLHYKFFVFLVLVVCAACTGFTDENTLEKPVKEQAAVQHNKWFFSSSEKFWYKVVGEGIEESLITLEVAHAFENVYFEKLSQCPIEDQVESVWWILGGHDAVYTACDNFITIISIPEDIENEVMPLPEELSKALKEVFLIKNNLKEL